MKGLLKFAFVLLLLVLCGIQSFAKSHDPVIVPIKFHIVTDLIMHKDDFVMSNWVTDVDIEKTILPEVNRIWESSGITFELESVSHLKSLSPQNKTELVNYIVQARRDASGRSDSRRIQKLNKLIDWSQHSNEAINVYLVPYLGQTSQGNARRKKKRVFIGQYSDKASRAKKPPERFKLIESRPFQVGSLSRTLAHEIGHILKLKHPDKENQTEFNLLMGGKKQGYKLRKEDKRVALEAAKNLFED